MDIQAMMRQAQEMQERLQREMSELTVQANAGGGMVTVKCTGALEITEIVIAPAAIDPDDAEMLQDLVLAAVNEALQGILIVIFSVLLIPTGLAAIGGWPPSRTR